MYYALTNMLKLCETIEQYDALIEIAEMAKVKFIEDLKYIETCIEIAIIRRNHL